MGGKSWLAFRFDLLLQAQKKPPAGVSRWLGRGRGIGFWREYDEEGCLCQGRTATLSSERLGIAIRISNQRATNSADGRSGATAGPLVDLLRKRAELI